MDNSKWPAKAVFPVAVPGIKYIIIIILITGMLFYFGWIFSGLIALMICLFVCWFFRDPERSVPDQSNALVSPADGRVIIVSRVDACEYLDVPSIKISIFMNVFNVHVNRMPFGGMVEKVIYSPGKFINASFDKASEHNERNALIVRTADNKRYAVVQIAGLVARRIVNFAEQGDTIETGRRYGMIQFGSRLDLYLPENFDIKVSIGEKVSAARSIIGYMT